MTSVMNSSGCKLDRGSDLIDEPPARPRVPDDNGAENSGAVVDGATDVCSCVNFDVTDEAGASPLLESTANDVGVGAVVGDSDMKLETVESENGRSEDARVCEESDGRGCDREMESRVLEDKADAVASRDCSYQYDCGVDGMEGKEVGRSGDGFGPWNDLKTHATSRAESENSAVAEWNDQKGQIKSRVGSGKSAVSEYESMLCNFDDYVANEKRGVTGTRDSDAVGYGFRVGDMVWGKVKSHPWWPGHIFGDAFASPSVRRTRREGHVLVAFFGDSSYGWFDVNELIHFDPHYAEKSQQMASRNFTNAVEEAVDEVNKRSSLGLACRCRNPYNFRPANVQGYFAVDVPDYEPAGIYSGSQIRKARDSFKPDDTLAFIKMLALAPRAGEQRSVDWIKSRAKVLAYRKAVYEEFDETYAQAFGMQAVRPSHEPKGVLDLQFKEPSQAFLSGPLVIEPLGDGKTSRKPIKVKDQAKKDKYLFKRRDDPSNSKSHHIKQGQTNASSQPVFVEQSSLAARDYVFQKRIPSTSQSLPIIARPPLDKGNVGVQDLKERTGPPEMAPDSTSPGGSECSGGQAFSSSINGSPVISQQHDDLKNEITEAFKVSVGFQLPNNSNPLGAAECHGQSHVHDVPTKPRLPGEILRTTVSGVKKAKLLKRPLEERGSGKSSIVEKKKKRKNEINLGAGSIHSQKQQAARKDGAALGRLSGKSVGSNSNDDNQVDLQDYAPGSVIKNNSVGAVLSDFQSLALDPFHGVERNILARQFILRFRSLVFQKSLVLSPPADTDPTEVRSLVPQRVRGFPYSRSPKPPFRPDDPTKAGRKRSLSDRQEEITGKLKKINNLKPLTAEKAANLKAPDPPVPALDKPAPAPEKPAKPKVEPPFKPPVKVEEPTMLVMKFPPQTSLPSIMELKARFARFGPLDLSGTRVFWTTHTCRVVFKYKADAQAACKYATGNSSLFGNVPVRYHLREVEVQGRAEEATNENLQLRDPLMPSPVGLQRPTLQPSVQLKSCLKKSSGEEVVMASGGLKGTPRVKFMLGVEESNDNASLADGGGAPPVAMDFNSKDVQKVIPSTSSQPILPFPRLPKFANNLHQPEALSPGIMHDYNMPLAPTGIDISRQMLNLLRRCNDVIANLNGALGYVPYHTL